MRACLPRALSWSVACLLLVSRPVFGCGPDFPNSYLAAGESDLVAAPEGYFAEEIARLKLPDKPRGEFVESSRDDVVSLDIADLRRALAARGDSPREIMATAEAYAACRWQLEAWVSRRQTARESRRGAKGEEEPMPELAWPRELPTEFSYYTAGAVAWHRGESEEACAAWARLLALPAEERQFRSTWAAFMIGRAWVERAGPGPKGARAAATAARNFHLTRALAAEGFRDPLGLAVASLGWEARAALAARDCAGAINLYLAQYAAADESALASLREAAAKAAELDEAGMVALAADAPARQVLTAYFVAKTGTSSWEESRNERFLVNVRSWAGALDKAGMHAVPEADRLAWIAYEGGMFALAEDWVRLAPADSAASQWIRAKLALREGRLVEGEQRLRGALALKGLNDPQRALALAELGRVCLAEDKPREALTAWIEGGHAEDAAYVAERVLGLDELRAYADEQCPPSKLVPAPAWNPAGADELRARIRHLLARRLARAGKADAAEAYFPEQWRDAFHAYAADVRLGFDIARPAGERAAAFWRAARAVHEHGMELLGTELEPDWAIWDGDFETAPVAEFRTGPARSVGGTWAPTPDEVARVKEHAVPAKRFHYRYRAADLAWWAAALLPNDAEETARILDEAGRWLKTRDRDAAQKFYQALVIRCGNTPLGRAAARDHWLPKNDTQ